MLTSNDQSLGPIAQTYACLFNPLHNNSLIIHDQRASLSQYRDMWRRAEVMMTDQIVLLSQVSQTLIFVFLYNKRFLLDVLFQFEHFEGLLTQYADNRIFGIRIEKDIKIFLILFS